MIPPRPPAPERDESAPAGEPAPPATTPAATAAPTNAPAAAARAAMAAPATERAPTEQAATERAATEPTSPAAEAARVAPTRGGIPGQRSGPRRTRAAEPGTGAADADEPEDTTGADEPGVVAADTDEPEVATDVEAQASGAAGRATPAKKVPSKAPRKAPAKKALAKKLPSRKAAARKAAPAEPTDLPPADQAPTDLPPTDQAPTDLPPADLPPADVAPAPAETTSPGAAQPASPPQPDQPASPPQPDQAASPPKPGQAASQTAPGQAAGPAPAGPPELTLWDRLRSDPAHVPEVLALAAVERLGPEAARYTGWVRATYPGATDDRLAQAAGRRFAAQARSAALAGMIAPEIGQLVALVTLGWLQARLVLHIAAAYGRDPSAPERAAELLVLLRVHDDLATARDALATARDNGVPLRRPAHRLLSGGARGAGRRLAARLIPGAGVLIDLLVNDASIEAVTRRAISYYRTPPAPVSGAPAGTAEGAPVSGAPAGTAEEAPVSEAPAGTAAGAPLSGPPADTAAGT
ncbi:hypothetical protein [Rugosimonospora africana]|uniref:Uncharacterized protein n=1 Tax=Rugosimonospora africana TaxID=556532 RepID=A0A8J3VNB6_9ACTN|nr:hypothetical protein [Rugosimonospora africana]GIH13059.1 hypothetical protein Raf01_12310 [Rugosimonospora africana]